MPVPDSYTILITGAGSGLGHGLSLYFAATGHRVLATDKCAESVKATAAEAGANVTAFELDVSSHAQIAAFGDSLDGRHVDVLVNNAGLQHVAQLEEFPPEKWDQLIDVMLKGSAAMTRLVLPGMRQHNFGRIVNMTTVAVPMRLEGEAIYASSKAAVEMLTRVLAKEFAEFGITVNAVGPSPIETNLIRGVAAEKIQNIIDAQSVHKMATFGDVVNIVDFFVRRESRYVSGQILYLGGF